MEFRQLREVGVFSYLVTSYLKCHENGVWELSGRNGRAFQSKKKKGDCMLEVGIALGQSTAGHGTMLHSPKNYFGLKMSM